jgi:hypothetical protein
MAGCTTYDPAGARVNAALTHGARKRIVLADAAASRPGPQGTGCLTSEKTTKTR